MFALFMLVTTLPETGDLLLVYTISVLIWSLIFLVCDIINLNHRIKSPLKSFGFTFNSSFEITALPFNLKLWWRKVSKEWPRFYTKLKLNLKIDSNNQQYSEIGPKLPTTTTPEGLETRPLPCQLQYEERRRPPKNDRHCGISDFVEKMKYRFSILISLLLYIIALPFLCIWASLLLFPYNMKVLTVQAHEEGKAKRYIKYIFVTYFLLLKLGLIMTSIQILFLVAFYFTIGLFLNGEIYSPYFVPLFAIIFYAWTKWMSLVETKYLVLATNIYEVCLESVSMEGDERSKNTTKNVVNANNISPSSSTCHFTNRFKIELDGDGEPIIPKALYDLVREMFLPYDRILFHYFQGFFFIAIFAYILYIIMSLAQTSEISNSVQVIGTIAATTMPFIFDFVWEKNSEEQKTANIIALKLKLKRILLLHSLDNKTGEMVVELVKEGRKERMKY